MFWVESIAENEKDRTEHFRATGTHQKTYPNGENPFSDLVVGLMYLWNHAPFDDDALIECVARWYMTTVYQAVGQVPFGDDFV